MATVKTALSLDKSLFNQIERSAADLNVSRSRLITMAVEEFLRKLHNRQLLAAINAAYADPPDEEEQQTIEAFKQYAPKVLDPW